MSDEYSWLYVISNTSMPGVFKVGISRDPEQRIRELRSTGTPGYFELEYLANTCRARQLESEIHSALSEFCTVRDNGPGREWFRHDRDFIVGAVIARCRNCSSVVWHGTVAEWRALVRDELQQKQRQAAAAAAEQKKREEEQAAAEFRDKCRHVARIAAEWLDVHKRKQDSVSRQPKFELAPGYYPTRLMVAAVIAIAATAFVCGALDGGKGPPQETVVFVVLVGAPLGWACSSGLVERRDRNAEALVPFRREQRLCDEKMNALGKQLRSLVLGDQRLFQDDAFRKRLSGQFHVSEVEGLLAKAKRGAC